MSLFQIILFLIVISILLIVLVFDTYVHKAEEEQLKKEIKKLKTELRRLKNDFDRTPERRTEDLQEELSELSENLKLEIQKVNALSEQFRKFDMLSRKIEIYQKEKLEFKKLLIQLENQKSEINSILHYSLSDMTSHYYDILEKIKKAQSVQNMADAAHTINRLFLLIDNLSQNLSNKEAGRRFEKIICILLKANGFTQIRTTKDSNDDGIDIFAFKDTCAYAIQCKCYLKDVDKKAIQEIAAGSIKYPQTRTIAVTNRHFNSYARQFAGDVNVELWEREKIMQMMKNLTLDDFASCIRICEKPETKAVKISVSRNKK